MQKKATRFVNYAVQRNYYYETHNDKGVATSQETEAEWCQRIGSEWSNLALMKALRIAFIFHDKDVDDSGNPKGLHAHAVITFGTNISQSQAMTATKCSSPNNCQGVKNKSGAYRYLLHITDKAINEMKHIYPESSVYAYSSDPKKPFNYRKALTSKGSKDDEEENLAMNNCLRGMMLGQYTLPDIRSIYEHDTFGQKWDLLRYIKDKSKFVEAEKDYVNMMLDWYSEHARCLTNIFITGSGGLGKSTIADALAKVFADNRGIHKVAVPGKSTTFDFAGTFHGQAVSVFNELSADAFSLEQFCSMFDPIRAETANSRNYDKPWYAKFAIFTTSTTLEQFVYDLWLPYAKQKIELPESVFYRIRDSRDSLKAYEKQNSNIADKIRQVRRRFAIYICLYDDVVDIYLRRDLYNMPHVFIFDGYPQGQEPIVLYKTIPFDVNVTTDVTTVVNCVKDAIPEYYKLNNYSITPDTVEKPKLII